MFCSLQCSFSSFFFNLFFKDLSWLFLSYSFSIYLKQSKKYSNLKYIWPNPVNLLQQIWFSIKHNSDKNGFYRMRFFLFWRLILVFVICYLYVLKMKSIFEYQTKRTSEEQVLFIFLIRQYLKSKHRNDEFKLWIFIIYNVLDFDKNFIWIGFLIFFCATLVW